MSLNSAMLTGVAGLSANSTSLSVTSANISNSNTTGYKSSSASFSTLLAGQEGASSVSSVTATATQEVSSQGELSSADSTTDLAIDGNGFFITSTTSDGTNVEYTRAGDFYTDDNYQLVNTSGLYLMGYSITTAADGTQTTSTALSTITLDDSVGISEPSTAVALSGNLESTTDVNTSGTADFSTSFTLYDSQGSSRTFTVSFTKTDANTWTYTIDYAGDAADLASGDTEIDNGTITFNTDGSLASITSSNASATSGGTITLDIDWSDDSGVSDQSIDIDWGTIDGTDGFTQYATTSTASYSTDGAAYGEVSSYSISEDGTITATYSNGLTRDLYTIPLAIFADPDGLTAVSGTAFTASDASGEATIVTAGTQGSGTVNSGYLEDSTVDLATELTSLITTQRAYSACAKIVTTTTNMLDVLVNMGS